MGCVVLSAPSISRPGNHLHPPRDSTSRTPPQLLSASPPCHTTTRDRPTSSMLLQRYRRITSLARQPGDHPRDTRYTTDRSRRVKRPQQRRARSTAHQTNLSCSIDPHTRPTDPDSERNLPHSSLDGGASVCTRRDNVLNLATGTQTPDERIVFLVALVSRAQKRIFSRQRSPRPHSAVRVSDCGPPMMTPGPPMPETALRRSGSL